MVTKRKPVKRKKNAGARDAGHPASAAHSAVQPIASENSEALSAADGVSEAQQPATSGFRATSFRANAPASPRFRTQDAVAHASDDAERDGLDPHQADKPEAEVANDGVLEASDDAVPRDSDSVNAEDEVNDAVVFGVVDDPFEADGERAEQQPADKPSEESSSEGNAPSAGTVGKKRKSAKDKKLKPWVRAVIAAVAAVAAALSLLVGVYSWDRWFRYDDSLDFVGEWQIHNSQATILIDGQYLVLAPDASLEYTLDTTTKTINFTLGNMQGGGRYCFSADRNQLVIEDGTYGSWLANAWHDAGWRFNQLMHAWFGAPLWDLSRDGLSVLDRAGTQASQADEEADQTAASEEEAAAGDQAAADGVEQAAAEEVQPAEGEGGSESGQEEQPAEPQEEFQGGQASGTAGGNAVTLEELQGAVS